VTAPPAKRPVRLETVSALGRAPARTGRIEPPPLPPEDQSPWARVRSLLRGAFLENLILKFVSMVLALTVFILVNTDREREIVARVGVSYTVPEDKVLVSERIDEVRVTVQGPWRRIKRFDEREIDRIHLDLSHVQGGEVLITPDMIQLPQGLHITSVTPRVLRVAFEKRATKDVDVAPVLAGRPLHGYIVTGTQVDPPRVTVRGAEGLVSALPSVRSEEIRVDGRSDTFETQVPLVPPDGVDVSPEGAVAVTVRIEEQLVTRRVGPLEVALEIPGSDPARFKSEPAEVTVVLTGGLRAIERALEQGIRAVVKVSPADAARPHAATVAVEGAPPGVGVQVLPPRVTIGPRR